MFSTAGVLATKASFIQVVPPLNYTGAATTDIYITTKNTTHTTFIIAVGAFAGGTAAVTLLQAKTQAGGSSKALSMPTMYTNKATPTTDATLVSTAVVSDTFNLDTANSVWLVEVDSTALDVTNGFDCVCLHIATPGSNADNYCVIAIQTQLGYSGKTPPNPLVD